MKRLEKKLSSNLLSHQTSHNLIKEASVQHIRTHNEICAESDSEDDLYKSKAKKVPGQAGGVLDLNRNTFKPTLNKTNRKADSVQG